MVRNSFVVMFSFVVLPVFSQSLDVKWLKTLHTPTPQYSDPFWRALSNAAAPISVLPTVGSGIAFLLEKDADKKKNLKWQTIEMGGAWAIAVGTMYIAKNIANRPRPFVAYPQYFFPKMEEKTTSFPSGHTTVAFVAATSLSLRYPKWYVIAPAYAFAGGVAYSRMHLGVHYPSDVLGGALLGSASAWAVWRVNRWWTRTQNKKNTKLIGGFGVN
ncbi:MAG: hypothetical protein RL757_767 [Bacteroidota bacterium]|jgi:undecaprenyl-diphosphatase